LAFIIFSLGPSHTFGVGLALGAIFAGSATGKRHDVILPVTGRSTAGLARSMGRDTLAGTPRCIGQANTMAAGDYLPAEVKSKPPA
jgi:hypothetical protein